MKSLRCAVLSMLLVFPAASAFAVSASSADCLMNWAEQNHRSHFPAAAASQTVDKYYFRYYPATQIYLGIDNSTEHLVFAQNNSLLDLGLVSGWLATSGCTASSAATTTSFYNFHYLQNVNGVPAATGSIVDNGANVVGSVTFGPQGTTATFTPQLNGDGYSWGSPMSYGNGYGSNPKDKNVPAVAAICQRVAGTGSNRGKLTDVLVTKDAIAITSAAGLANLKFSAYYEDCQLSAGDSMSFDGEGNATVMANSTVTVDAAAMTGALTGTPLSVEGWTTFTAYSYVDSQSGKTRYVLVEHGSNSMSNLTQGYLGIWLEDANQ